MEEYTPFGHSDYQTIIAKIKKFASEGKKTAVVSTINGDSNVPFYKELGNAGLKATDVPVVAFSVGEEELRGVDTKPLVGHLAAWNYFQSIKNPENDAFIKMYRDWAKKQKLPKADTVVTNDPMEATYIGIHMWKQAVEKAKSTDVDKVIAAMAGQTFKAPSGFTIKMDEKNHHLHKPVFIGEVKADGQFNVVWKTKGPVKAQPWSPSSPATTRRRTSRTASKPAPPGTIGNDPLRRSPEGFFTEHENMRTLCFAFLLWFAALPVSAAPDPALVRQLAAEDSDEKIAAIQKLAQSADPAALPILQTDWPTAPSRATDGGEITINNRVRGELAGALAALRLFDPNRAVRLAAAKELLAGAEESMVPLLVKARDLEGDGQIKGLLSQAHAVATIKSPEVAVRLAAVQALAISGDPNIKSLLLARSEPANESRSRTCAAPPSAPIWRSRTA